MIISLCFNQNKQTNKEQASWVCQCDEEIVHQIESSFKVNLKKEFPINFNKQIIRRDFYPINVHTIDGLIGVKKC